MRTQSRAMFRFQGGSAEELQAVLGLHRRKTCADLAGGGPGKGPAMLPVARGSSSALREIVLVLHQRRTRPGERSGMPETRWPMLRDTRGSPPALQRKNLLGLHRQPSGAGDRGGEPRE